MPLLQMMPDQAMHYWDVLRDYIEQSLPPYAASEHSLLRIQEDILVGNIQCWIFLCGTPDAINAKAFITTRIVTDESTLTRNLLIFTFTANEHLTDDEYRSGYESLIKFASSRKCSKMIAYSNVDKVVKLAAQLGADCSYRFMSFDVLC
jgi:hypothetical protein